MGNLTEKQAQLGFGKKIQKNVKQHANCIQNQGGKSEKTSPK